MTNLLLRLATSSDAEQLGALHVASWQETYAGILPVEMLNQLTMENRSAAWSRILGDAPFSGAIIWVAENEGRIVGFGSCGRQRDQRLGEQGFDAEISAIYILRSYQGLGLGRALMGAMAASLRDRGRHAATLWVLRENEAARGFYERLGGTKVAEKEDVRPQAALIEVAYGWRDLKSLNAKY